MRFCPPRAVIGFVLLLALAALAHALTFPQLTGRVVDEANVLDAATRQALTDKLAAVEAKSGDQIVVVTLKSLQDTSIEDYGYQLGRHWGIGQKGTNNGAIADRRANRAKGAHRGRIRAGRRADRRRHAAHHPERHPAAVSRQ